MKQKPVSNYDYFVRMDTSRYRGEWVAIADKKVVAHGKDAESVYKEAKKRYKVGDISLAKAPNEQMLVLRFWR